MTAALVLQLADGGKIRLDRHRIEKNERLC